MNISEALQLLGLARGYTKEDLKKAYRKLSKKYHPDMVGVGESDMFMRITEAYKFLQSYEESVMRGVTHQSIFTVTIKN